MSFRTPVNCSTNNIGNLEEIFLDEMGAAFNNIVNQIGSIESQITESGLSGTIDEGNSILQDLISTGGPSSNIRYLDEIPVLFGIDSPNNQESDEKRIFDTTDLILTNGVFFKKPEADGIRGNVETLRRIYNSVGKDLTKAEAEYNKVADSSYRYKIAASIVAPRIPNKSLTLAEIRTSLNDNTVIASDYVELEDKSVILVRKNPLLVPDLTEMEIPPRFGYNVSEVTSSIIHKTSAKNTTAAINNWINQGYDIELPAILDGEDPAINFEVLNPLFDNIKRLSGILLSDLNFYLSRVSSIDGNPIKAKIRTQLDSIYTSTMELMSVFLTEVSTITEFDTIAKLRDKLTDLEIEHLLLNQRYVADINLDATETEVMNSISAITQAAGDNTASTAYLNTNPSLRDANYSIVLYVLSDIQRAIAVNQTDFNSVMINKMINIITTLNSRILVTEIPDKAPVGGYPSYTTASSIAIQRMNFNKNFKVTLKFKELDEALTKLKNFYDENVGRVLGSLLKSLATIVREALAMINQLRDRLLSQIFPLKRKLDEFISKYLTLIGGGDFDSSVFKCAINYNIGISSHIFDKLEAMIKKLAEQLSNIVAGLTSLFLDMINKVICPVLAFIEKIMGSANDYLPSFCSINAPVLLPEEAVKALQDLRRVALMQNVAFTVYNGDLVKLRAAVTTAPDRLDTFRDGANCLGKTVSNMLSDTLLLVTPTTIYYRGIT